MVLPSRVLIRGGILIGVILITPAGLTISHCCMTSLARTNPGMASHPATMANTQNSLNRLFLIFHTSLLSEFSNIQKNLFLSMAVPPSNPFKIPPFSSYYLKSVYKLPIFSINQRGDCAGSDKLSIVYIQEQLQ